MQVVTSHQLQALVLFQSNLYSSKSQTLIARKMAGVILPGIEDMYSGVTFSAKDHPTLTQLSAEEWKDSLKGMGYSCEFLTSLLRRVFGPMEISGKARHLAQVAWRCSTLHPTSFAGMCPEQQRVVDL